jgi:hypothetical protein
MKKKDRQWSKYATPNLPRRRVKCKTTVEQVVERVTERISTLGLNQITREGFTDSRTPIHIVDQAFKVLAQKGWIYGRPASRFFVHEYSPKVFNVRYNKVPELVETRKLREEMIREKREALRAQYEAEGKEWPYSE